MGGSQGRGTDVVPLQIRAYLQMAVCYNASVAAVCAGLVSAFYKAKRELVVRAAESDTVAPQLITALGVSACPVCATHGATCTLLPRTRPRVWRATPFTPLGSCRTPFWRTWSSPR